MPSERVQRRIDAMLDEIEEAAQAPNWVRVRELCDSVLRLDPGNEDARAFLEAATREPAAPAQQPPFVLAPLVGAGGSQDSALAPLVGAEGSQDRPVLLPTAFAAGRYRVLRLLGQGGRKRVFLARDTRLDREVALAVVPGESLSAADRERFRREARAMARLGANPHLVSIFDIGEDGGDLFTVQEYMAGGDVAGLLATEGESRLPVERTLAIAKDVCRALTVIHQAGIVHRDLKPANVFLGADGTARLGDFGLAADPGLDRLTQHGTMLGTVAYMPPEQALGGEITPKADLYSLGAMLYEMVTGRPPFVADDPTAVISQHINMAPVAPSWLTEHCPPSLEALVLRLLEKGPDKRPAGALAVLHELEAVDPAQKSTRHSDENPLARLSRGVFVGREKELERLRNAFDDAFAGRGGLVMLVGEPGIGKTRAAQELETYARMRSATVLWGRAHESSGAPPYWPWKQVGDAHARFVPADELAREFDPEQVAELSRIFPTLRTAGQPLPVSDSEAAQFRLFDAYTAFIRAGAERAPLLIVLDDLHWADKPSLLLLQHLARELSRLRVLVVGTYRDTELSRTHPLSEVLANLNREAGFLRIPLRGLSREEVDAYIRAAARVSPPARVIDRIFEETEGNPFFLSEVVNLMTQEGTLARESVSDIAIPDGVREALGRRLDRISEPANELLQVCAVAGREFTYETLTLLGERGEDELLVLLEEALAARVIEETDQPGRYRFTHALMQETLLDELTTTRRVRIHGQVGEALERRWGARADERASRLAHHFVEAAMLSPRFAAKAVRYAKLAAGQAESQTGWDEAVSWYERTLALVDGSDEGLVEDEGTLLTSLGRCYLNASDPRGAWRSLMRAIGLYRQRGDAIGVARATVEAQTVLALPDRLRRLADEALAMLGDADPHLEALLLAHRAGESLGRKERAAAKRAAELADANGFADVAALLSTRAVQEALRAGEWDLMAEKARLAHGRLREAGFVTLANWTLNRASQAVTLAGRLAEALGRTDEVAADASRIHHRVVADIAHGYAGTIALLRCDYPEFERRASQISESNFGGRLLRARGLAQQGDLAGAMAARPRPDDPNVAYVYRELPLGNDVDLAFVSRDLTAARTALASWFEACEAGGTAVPEHLAGIGMAAECLAALGTPGQIRSAYEDLMRYSTARTMAWAIEGFDRPRGVLALALGDIAAAEAHFATGLQWAERECCPVVMGRCRQGLAEVALRRGDSPKALDHLDHAGELFRAHRARLFLDQVIARKVELQGLSSEDQRSSIVAVNASVQRERPDLSLSAASDGTVTLLFSDIENSTPLNERLGDAAWMELLRRHNALIEERVRAHGGRVVKTMGDGYMVAFGSARDGLRCAQAIQRAFAEGEQTADGSQQPAGLRPQSAVSSRQTAVSSQQSASAPLGTRNSELGTSGPVRVRIGLHTGEPVRQGDDFYGTHVVMASRIAAHAAGGEILVSALLRELVAASGEFALEARPPVALKGLAGEHVMYEVGWS